MFSYLSDRVEPELRGKCSRENVAADADFKRHP